MAAADRPLSIRESLHGLLTAFRLISNALDVDLGATTITVSVPGRTEALATLTLADLIARSETALAVADMAHRNPDVAGQHSPLPWDRSASEEAAERRTLYDGVGTAILFALDTVTEAEALATLAMTKRAVNAFPLLKTTIEAAVHALRSYQHGNTAADLAKEAADACDVVLAQMEGR